MRKPFLSLIISLLLLLTACAPASIAPTSTPTVTKTATNTPTNTLTPSPTSTATITPTSTPDISDLYYPGLAPTVEIFDEHLVEKSQIAAIIADLRSKPSLLPPDAKPFIVRKGGSTTDTSVNIVCNTVSINCAVGASISVFEDGIKRDIVIIETKNGDNTPGYITGFRYDKGIVGSHALDWLSADFTNFIAIIITQKTTALKYYTENYPYDLKLMQQDGYVDFTETINLTGIIPQEHEDMILSVGF